MNHFYHPQRHFKILRDDSQILMHKNFHLSQSYLTIKWEEGSRTHIAYELQ